MLRILEINKLIANAFFVLSVFHDSLKFSKFTRICMESHSSVWLGGKSCFSHTNPSNFQRLLQLLLWYIRLKIYWLPKFDMLFQLLLTNFSKSELFLCLQKVDHVTNYCKKKKIGGMGSLGEEYLWGLKTLTSATMSNPSSPNIQIQILHTSVYN